jgi:hypothetical protein
MTKKNIFFVLFLLGVIQYSKAQKYKNKEVDIQKKDFFLRWNATSLLDPLETNFSMGAEYRLRDNVSVSLDAAYVFFSQYYSRFDDLKANGFIIRPAVRYYFDSDIRGYFEGEFHFKQMNYQFTDWLQKDIADGVPSYQELTNFKQRKQVFAFNFKLGYLAKLSSNNRFWLDPYMGIGVKYRKQFLLNQPPRTSYNYNNSAFRTQSGKIEEPRKAAMPNLSFGMRVLIKLNK